MACLRVMFVAGSVVCVTLAIAVAYIEQVSIPTSVPPPVSCAQIQAEGGRCLLFDDGKRPFEYFVFGEEKAYRHTLLAFHPHSTSGHFYSHFSEIARDQSLRILSPSLPGWGLSATRGTHMPTLKEVMQTDVERMLERELKRPDEPISIGGISMGAAFAVAASGLLSPSHNVSHLQLMIPFGPHTAENSPFDAAPFSMRLLITMFNWPPVSHLFTTYFSLPLLVQQPTGVDDFLRVLTPDDYEATHVFKPVPEWVRHAFWRSVKHTSMGMRFAVAGLLHDDWSFLPTVRERIKGTITVTMAEQDGMIAKNNPLYYHKVLNGSRLVSLNTSHIDALAHPAFTDWLAFISADSSNGDMSTI